MYVAASMTRLADLHLQTNDEDALLRSDGGYQLIRSFDGWNVVHFLRCLMEPGLMKHSL